MISKELLSEVLGYEVFKIRNCNVEGQGIQIAVVMQGIPCNDQPSWGEVINIYELAHKCKEWSLKKGYMLNSWYTNEMADGCSIGNIKAVCSIYKPYEAWSDKEYSAEADTEPEAVFKACQWILDNKDNNASNPTN